MTFIIAATYMCAAHIARKRGLKPAQVTVWTPRNNQAHRLRGTENPAVLLADCGRISEEDLDMVRSRMRDGVTDIMTVGCDHS